VRIDDACLVIDDVDASDAYYTALGLERRMRNVRFADFVLGTGPRLAMWTRPSIAETVGPSFPTQAGQAFSLTLDLDAEGLHQAGGGRVLVDPDGFVLRLRDSADGIRRLSEIDLTVTDLDATTEFLLLLGFTVTGSLEGARVFSAGEVSLTLYEGAQHLQSPLAQGAELDLAPSTGHLMLAIELETGEQVDELYRTLLARGLSASGPPAVFEWGARSTYFLDADGYIWEIYAWVETPR
jgi:catechol 2,3-dioxygenase-like lactoylglutathione lyase family enzyme